MQVRQSPPDRRIMYKAYDLGIEAEIEDGLLLLSAEVQPPEAFVDALLEHSVFLTGFLLVPSPSLAVH